MSEIFSVKVRKIGSSAGVIMPKDQLDSMKIEIGDEIDISVLKHRNPADIEAFFGIAKDFKHKFERDKTAREF